MSPLCQSALRLHQCLVDRHWRDGLIGPDPGIRFNYRIGRFVKSALPWAPWGDAMCYAQAQGYWTLANWRLYDRTSDEQQRQLAIDCSDVLLARQRPDGAWDYPNPEWKGRLATTEGNWAALGLLETYRRTRDEKLLAGAARWLRFLTQVTGFQRVGDELAVNYFANECRARVCNNSVTTLRVLAEAAEAMGDDSLLREYGPGLTRFLERAQLATGELPYVIQGPQGGRSQTHFQCFQYNAFACLNLIRYFQLTDDPAARSMVLSLLEFLARGQAPDGHAYYACDDRRREVTYHTAALAAALAAAAEIGIDGYGEAAQRGYAYLLRRQRPDGAFDHSRREHYVLRDRRAYPRYLAMILYHLLHACPPERATRPQRSEEPTSALS